MKFNEDSRVKLPSILHLTRLGYEYISLKTAHWDNESNIFPGLFTEAITNINSELTVVDAARQLSELKLSLDNLDLGKAFFEKITNRSGIKLIDFENFNNNTFHVVTELPYINGDEEFRPDITLLINGMPLIFIEVKKPNNKDGILAERERINRRFKNSKFRRFANITQLMVFSNNMDYDDGAIEPIEGAFYASPSYDAPIFNYFREEETLNLSALLKPLSEETELIVLKDNNLEVIRNNPEFTTNKEPSRPTNRICTSLFNRERLSFLLQYGIAYVNETNGIEKHVMRYPQLFATKAIEQKLNEGIKKGIIWHTQGSGKTALAFYNVRHLTDYFQRKNTIPKFYFIVDRLDLLTQAQREFSARGLVVHVINSRDEFAKDIKTTKVINNNAGKPEITVVNIQKFQDDPDVISTKDYDINIQRIYFLDEVHRSYNPKGSFLANLEQSDSNAIKIGLTGTPLLGNDYNSRKLFGDYIHKYYYNKSIADGYTLRLIREEISTSYKLTLQKALEQIQVQQGKIDKSDVYADSRFVEPMLDYIVNDFESSRETYGDHSIGAMVICDSADQANTLYEIFNAKYANIKATHQDAANDDYADYRKAAQERASYQHNKQQSYKVKTAALILHNVGDKEFRKDLVEDFKAGKIDLLIVFNMLLTGFDAKRLKKLYLGRVIRKHNLLQALTRVNRTYKKFRYGYVVDFADISKEFAETNREYLEELQSELGDEMEHYSHLFKSQEEIKQEIEHIKDVLFRFDTHNAEIFSQQIEKIQDKKTILALKKALEDARALYNIIRLQGDYDFLNDLDFQKLNMLYRETSNHLDLLNTKEQLASAENTANLLNIALEDIIFKFIKIGEQELVLADQLKNTLRQTREALASNFDQQDPKFISLKEELERLFKKKNLSEVTQQEMTANIVVLEKIHTRIKELNRENNQLRQKYHGDVKYARIHKRLQEKGDMSQNERKIFEALSGVKHDTDKQVLVNHQLIENESYFTRMVMPSVIGRFVNEQAFNLNPSSSNYINQLVVTEYMKEFHGRPQL
ncbi:MAG: DEAD/DEAH box helicase family protein [Methylophilus sp.]|nr:DEAD/DEAH box helicase family protein [Methylophilus sp.]